MTREECIKVIENLQKMYASQILCEYTFFKERAEALSFALQALKDTPTTEVKQDLRHLLENKLPVYALSGVDRVMKAILKWHRENMPSEERITEIMVKHIASTMKPPITFDDQAYKILGNLAPKGIKDLAHRIFEEMK